jgi:hypothetical protein
MLKASQVIGPVSINANAIATTASVYPLSRGSNQPDKTEKPKEGKHSSIMYAPPTNHARIKINVNVIGIIVICLMAFAVMIFRFESFLGHYCRYLLHGQRRIIMTINTCIKGHAVRVVG